jgi:hypothetical protein
LVLVLFSFLLTNRNNAKTTDEALIPTTVNEDNMINEEALDSLLDNIQNGGPPPDGIPPIDSPTYISYYEADFYLQDTSKVFVLEYKDDVYVFPQNIMVWHEIVNLDEGVCLTYCPLTGSAITYVLPAGNTFGTSGKLINSNLLMYDRLTDSYISQIDGIGLNKDLRGTVLDTIPTFWVDYKTVKETYENPKILNYETGFLRDYGYDPYGSYTDLNSSNYYFDDGLIFPIMNEDDAYIFHEKYPIIGIKVNDKKLAFNPTVVKENKSYSFNLDSQDFTAVHDETLNVIRVYKGNLRLDNQMIIDEDGKTYNIKGIGETTLESPTYFEVMWFAWYAFYPDTEVIK